MAKERKIVVIVTNPRRVEVRWANMAFEVREMRRAGR